MSRLVSCAGHRGIMVACHDAVLRTAPSIAPDLSQEQLMHDESPELPLSEIQSSDARPTETTQRAFATETPVLPIVTTAESVRSVPEDEIRIRAYELYCSRGAADGDALSDWLAAERDARAAQAFGGSEEARPRS
jgi:hypothetical protein